MKPFWILCKESSPVGPAGSCLGFDDEEAVLNTLRAWKQQIEAQRRLYNQLSEAARENGSFLPNTTWEI